MSDKNRETKIFCGHLLDIRNQTWIDNACVTIAGGNITEVAGFSEAVKAGGCTSDGIGGGTSNDIGGRSSCGSGGATSNDIGGGCIDLRKMWVLPGLIDAHVHIGLDPATAPFLTITRKHTAYLAILALRNAQRCLDAGFTAIRDCGAWEYTGVGVKQAIDAGLCKGPRIKACGNMLTITGGHGDSYFAPNTDVGALLGVRADGPDEIRKAIRENVKHGADFVKACATGGILSDSDSPGATQYTLPELEAIAAEASREGMASSVHAIGTEGIKLALKAGITSIEHGMMLDGECIELLLERGAFMTATLSPLYWIDKCGEASGISRFNVEKCRMVLEKNIESVQKAYKAGVKLAFGTDSGTPHNEHGNNAFEFELLVKAGIKPLDAIKMATLNAAELLGISGKAGAVEPGMSADIIAVDADPEADMTALRHVGFVMRDGEVYRHSLR